MNFNERLRYHAVTRQDSIRIEVMEYHLQFIFLNQSIDCAKEFYYARVRNNVV